MAEIFNRVNWIDVIALILLIRISYTSSQIGVGKQLIPIFLLILILSTTLYTYREIANLFITRYSFTPSICEFLSYLFIVIIFFLIYHVISRLTGFFLFAGEIKTSGIERMGGATLGFLRSLLIIGIIMIGILLTPVKVIENAVKNSYSGFFFIRTNLRIYSWVMNLVLRNKEKTISHEKALAELASEKKGYVFKSSNIKQKSRFFQETY